VDTQSADGLTPAQQLVQVDRMAGQLIAEQQLLWTNLCQELREAGIAALKVAQTKDREKMEDVTNQVADACSTCHEPYRDKGDANSLARCTPPTKAEQERIDRAER
jgi:cytochrome c553